MHLLHFATTTLLDSILFALLPPDKGDITGTRATARVSANPSFSSAVTTNQSEFDSSVTRSNYTFILTLRSGDSKPAEFASVSWARSGVTAKNAGAVVFLSHGYAEYLGEPYERLAASLAALKVNGRGVFVFGHDHLGHGRSSGPKAQNVHGFSVDYVNPIIEHVKYNVGKRKKVFIVGHSLGGLMAILAAAQEPDLFSGMVLIAPAVSVYQDNPISRVGASVLGPILPDLTIGAPIKINDVTRVKVQREKLANDPLRYHGGGKAKNGVESLLALDRANKLAPSITIPTLVQQGEKDRLIRPEGVRGFYDRLGSADKTYIEYTDSYHNLLLEPPKTRSVVFGDLKKWLIKHL